MGATAAARGGAARSALYAALTERAPMSADRPASERVMKLSGAAARYLWIFVGEWLEAIQEEEGARCYYHAPLTVSLTT